METALCQQSREARSRRDQGSVSARACIVRLAVWRHTIQYQALLQLAVSHSLAKCRQRWLSQILHLAMTVLRTLRRTLKLNRAIGYEENPSKEYGTSLSASGESKVLQNQSMSQGYLSTSQEFLQPGRGSSPSKPADVDMSCLYSVQKVWFARVRIQNFYIYTSIMIRSLGCVKFLTSTKPS